MPDPFHLQVIDKDAQIESGTVELSMDEFVHIYRLLEEHADMATPAGMRAYTKIQKALFERLTLEELEEL